jgi:sulfur relay (sulfurtransferase) DsrC/TusE family protein
MRATYKHYENGKGYDVIDFIKDYDLNFNRGNAIKYLVRASHKGSEEQDLEKAIDYIQRELEYIRETKQDNPPY